MMIDIDLLLEKGATFWHVETGEIIFNEGAPATFYYQLHSGRVRWSHFGDNGKEVLHKIVEAGESFGDFPLFDGEPYAASAIADSSCTVLRLCASSFHKLLADHPDIHRLFTSSLAEHLRFKFTLSNALVKNNPQAILVELIDYFSRHDKLICKDCNRLMVTRQQLANMAGLRVETVIRAVKQLQQEEKLCIIKGKVFVPANGV